MKRSRKCQFEEVYEKEREAPKASIPITGDAPSPDDIEDHDVMEPQEPPCMTVSHKRKTAWAREIIRDAKRYGAPEGSSRQSKKPKPFFQLCGFDV